MDDLISKGELFNALAAAQTKGEIFAVIQAMPTKDAQLIHHAKWIDFHVTNDGVAEELCGKCENWSIGKNKDFCPVCGAKMDLKEDNSGK